MKLFNDKTKRFLKFGIVGGIGTIVNAGLFFLLNTVFKTGLQKWIIDYIFTAVCFEVAVVNNFLFSYFWVWSDKKGDIRSDFLKYNLSTLFAFLINQLFFQGARIIFHIDNEKQHILYNVIYVMAIGIGMLVNFVLIEFKVFKKKE
jgi:putative flippase GtrA